MPVSDKEELIAALIAAMRAEFQDIKDRLGNLEYRLGNLEYASHGFGARSTRIVREAPAKSEPTRHVPRAIRAHCVSGPIYR